LKLHIAALAWMAALSTTPALAQSSPGPERIDPDRPDVTNSAHLIGPGELQIEMGGSYVRGSRDLTSFGSPFLARIGVSDRIEARVGGDGWVGRSERDEWQSGFGNVQAAAKLRLVSDSHGAPIVSVLPAVNIPTASTSKGLGSGEVDYTLTMLTSVDVGARGHVDANYGIGRIGAGDRRPHFTQHVGSVSASVSVTERWDPYAELFWISTQEPAGGGILAVDIGAIYHMGHRLALDGGLQFGVTRAAPDRGAFAGLSVGLRRFAQ
jgi:hypothetical protein